jgi:hypothetical protein
MSITIDGELNTITRNNTFINLSKSTLFLPTGNTLQRPSNPIGGMIRYNTELNLVEGFNGTTWINLKT